MQAGPLSTFKLTEYKISSSHFKTGSLRSLFKKKQSWQKVKTPTLIHKRFLESHEHVSPFGNKLLRPLLSFSLFNQVVCCFLCQPAGALCSDFPRANMQGAGMTAAQLHYLQFTELLDSLTQGSNLEEIKSISRVQIPR